VANGKVHVNVNAVYNNGGFLFQDMKVPARIQLIKIEKAPRFMEVALRLVISDSLSEDLYEALNTSTTVSLDIEGVKPPLERDNETKRM